MIAATDLLPGIVGLGAMGRNFLLNIADHEYSVMGYDKDPAKVRSVAGDSQRVTSFGDVRQFVHALRKPRVVVLLVPAGDIVDSVIDDLAPYLNAGDLIIDGGNSHYADTNARIARLDQRGVAYMGMGISGGERGARRGPSLMPGGPKDAYDRVSSLLTDVAAHVDGEPCVAWLGPGSAGHYVKMVHNGIEYAIMQAIAETYDFMKRGLNLDNEAMHAVYARWNESKLAGYLIEITAEILTRVDEDTNRYLVDLVLDAARQKGTGAWTCQDAMRLKVPVPSIDAAVAMRNVSAQRDERRSAAGLLRGPRASWDGSPKAGMDRLENALYASMVISFAQGMDLLAHASQACGYELCLADVARIWRGGCIIRAAMLHDIHSAFDKDPGIANLMVAEPFRDSLRTCQSDLRWTVKTAMGIGLPVPTLAAGLGYFDAYRTARLPANLIQAQRDYFGSHTYERTDRSGRFHTDWQSCPGDTA